ncbi:MAG TPA: hypothetical protein PLG50_13050 [bacterium]|nr:hypothetical protein [bacterium]HQG46580.1 hypothetical protein [bacterium]HQI49276.1 hypothetical protein [bacterium]HQJ63294.1 hypothetical protein [bacterium]
MHRTLDEGAIQRTAEIIVLGPGGAGNREFLQAFCPDLRQGCGDLLLGSLTVHRELVLYCYSIGFGQEFAWDLVGGKILGYIAHFDWFDGASYNACRDLVNDTSSDFTAPFVVAADLGLQPPPVVESAIKLDIALSPSARFLFFQKHKPASVRRVVITLLDLLLEKLE